MVGEVGGGAGDLIPQAQEHEQIGEIGGDRLLG